MNKAMTFAKLDFLTVKSYLTIKSLAAVLAMPFIIIATTGISTSSASFFMMLSALFVSYPFIICEKNKMDALYATLSIPRSSVVLGRYVFTLALSICAGIVGFTVASAAMIITGEAIVVSEVLLATLVAFAVVSTIESFQITVFFRLGYEKAKIIANLPYFILWPAIMIFGKMIPKDFNLLELFSANPGPVVIAASLTWVCIMVISYRLSLTFYKRREF